MADPVRPVKLEVPLQGQKWTNPDGSATTYAHRYHHAVFMRLGAYNDDVWRALGVGFTGLTQVNQVNQRVSDVEAATAAISGAIAGMRGDDRLEDAVKALELATAAMVQVQARASGITDLRISNLDRLVSSFGGRLSKAQQTIQMQLNDLAFDSVQSEVQRTGTLQRLAAKYQEIEGEIESIEDDFEPRVRAAITGTAPVDYNATTGVFGLNASLTSLGGLTTAANKSYYTTGSNVWASYDLTAFGRSVAALADATAGRTLFGLGSLATLSSVNDSNWSGTDLAVANGGTGASTAAAARANLGFGITPLSVDIPVGSAVSLTSATAGDLGYIDLPDGTWLVQGNVYFIPAGGTTPSILRAWVSTVSATQPTIPNGGAISALAITFPAANGQVLTTGAAIITAVGTARVYLGTRCSFSGGTMTACGHMHAVAIL